MVAMDFSPWDPVRNNPLRRGATLEYQKHFHQFRTRPIGSEKITRPELHELQQSQLDLTAVFCVSYERGSGYMKKPSNCINERLVP